MIEMQCQVEDCEKERYKCYDYCCMHFRRWKRHGDPNIRLKEYGSGFTINNGYLMTKVNGEFIYEHRIVAERAYGPLPPGAEIHHIDGDRLNNDPSNLMVCRDKGHHNSLRKKP